MGGVTRPGKPPSHTIPTTHSDMGRPEPKRLEALSAAPGEPGEGVMVHIGKGRLYGAHIRSLSQIRSPHQPGGDRLAAR